MRGAVVATTALMLATAAGCGSSGQYDAPAPQAPVFYVPGLPYFYSELDVELPPGGEADSARSELQVNLLLYVPNASLSFLKTPDGYRARFDVTTRVTDPETGNLLRERTWSEGSYEARFEDTRLYSPHLITRSVAVPPGRYDLEIRVQDMDNRKQSTRRHRVEVADLRSRPMVTGRNRLESRRPDGLWEPAITNTVRRSADSLRIETTLLTLHPPYRIEGNLRVLRVPVDTAAGLPPYANPTVGGVIMKEFLAVGRPDTVHTAGWSIAATEKQTTLGVRIPPLPEGVYLFEAAGSVAGARFDSTEYHWGRWYTVRSQEYPRPVTLSELVGPLRYIANEKEWDAIETAPDPRERKRRFDQFWLGLAGSGPAAANLIKAYYSRVQEANLFFSGHKDGWRTDRGMVYIVMGPPPGVDRRFDQEIWRYGASEEDALSTFAFKRGVSSVEGTPFENYVLVRQYYYDTIWMKMVDKWRSGRVF